MKRGLDFFSFDVDFFEDEKIQYISARFGIKGEVCAIRLLTRLYRNGYFLKWDEDSPYLFAKVAGKEFSPGLVKGIVDELVRRGFFDESLLHSFGILTSHGIQKRYFKACERRKVVEVDERFLLVKKSDFKNLQIQRPGSSQPFLGKCQHHDDITDKNVYISTENDDIFAQSKVKESRYSTTTKEDTDVANVIKSYQDNIHPISGPIEADKLKGLIDTFGADTCLKAIERAVIRGGRSISYITGILNSWQQHGYDEEGEANGKRNTKPDTGTTKPGRAGSQKLRSGNRTNEKGSVRSDWSDSPDGWDF